MVGAENVMAPGDLARYGIFASLSWSYVNLHNAARQKKTASESNRVRAGNADSNSIHDTSAQSHRRVVECQIRGEIALRTTRRDPSGPRGDC